MADIYFEPCDYGNVCSCIMQFCKEEEERIKPCYGIYVFTVWFPDAAKEFLDINISDDQLTIMQKEIYQYKMLCNREHVQRIWDNGFIPVEIMKNGGGIFFGIPKSIIERKQYDSIVLEEMENI